MCGELIRRNPPLQRNAKRAGGRCAAAALTMVLALCHVTARADAYFWADKVNGNWDEPAKWGTADYPRLEGDTATVNKTGAAYTVTLNRDISIKSFLLDSADATFVSDGRTFTLTEDGCTVRKGLVKCTASTLSNLYVEAAGVVEAYRDSTISGYFTNAGSVKVIGTGDHSAVVRLGTSITNTGKIVLTSTGIGAAEWDHQGGQIFNDGEIIIEKGGGGSRTFRTGSGGMSNSGKFKVQTTATVGSEGNDWFNSGLFEVSGNGTVAKMKGTQFVNVQGSGKITGEKQLDLTGMDEKKVVNRSRVAPGVENEKRTVPAIGELSLIGDLEQAADGQIDIDLAGHLPGVDYDVLKVLQGNTAAGPVGGTASLAGTLHITIDPAFLSEIAPGDEFVVMHYVQRSGVFESLLVDPPGIEFETIYRTTELALVVTAVPEPAAALSLLAVLLVARRRG